MKVFDLTCDLDHSFEGWFASHEEFDRQLAAGLVECPVCGTRSVQKMLSAPRLNISGAQEPARAVKEPVAMPNEAAMRAMLAQMARHIIANTEDVGERFPEEAPRRSIRGVASKDEADALEDEGIDVMPVPFADLVKNSLN